MSFPSWTDNQLNSAKALNPTWIGLKKIVPTHFIKIINCISRLHFKHNPTLTYLPNDKKNFFLWRLSTHIWYTWVLADAFAWQTEKQMRGIHGYIHVILPKVEPKCSSFLHVYKHREPYTKNFLYCESQLTKIVTICVIYEGSSWRVISWLKIWRLWQFSPKLKC